MTDGQNSSLFIDLDTDPETMAQGWLKVTNGLGELIDYDFEKMSLDRLYQLSDQLWK